MVTTPGSPDQDFDDFPPNPGPGRKPVVNGRITGKVLEWRGKFGFIQPDEPIQHPDAFKKQGKVFLHQENVQEVITGVGAEVSFYVYVDQNGMGALGCVPADSDATKVPCKKPRAKVSAKPKAKSTPGRKRVDETLYHGKVKSWKESFGFIAPSTQLDHPLFTGSLFVQKADVAEPDKMAVGVCVKFNLYTDVQGLGAEQVVVVDEADVAKCSPAAAKEEDSPAAEAPTTEGVSAAPQQKPRTKAAAKPRPKATPGRKPVGQSAVTGTIKNWRGKFGFVTPTEPIDHPQFTGSIFLQKADVHDADKLESGSQVVFWLYEDTQGLGAEGCYIPDDEGATPCPASPAPAEEPPASKASAPTAKLSGATSAPTTKPSAPTPKPVSSAPAAKPSSTSAPTSLLTGVAPTSKASATALDVVGGSNLMRSKPKASPSSPTASSDAVKPFTAPTAKAKGKATMKANPKSAASAATSVRTDTELAKKMAAYPELAKQLSAWMFDPGG